MDRNQLLLATQLEVKTLKTEIRRLEKWQESYKEEIKAQVSTPVGETRRKQRVYPVPIPGGCMDVEASAARQRDRS
jgi:hypothetical protein